MIGIYLDCLKQMTEFCERRGFSHEDFSAVNQIIETFGEPVAPIISLTRVKKIVAYHFDLIPHQINTRSQMHKVRFPRQLAQYFAWILTTETLERIGRIVGDRDHATVSNSKKRIEQLRETKYPYHDYLKLKELDVVFAPYVTKMKENEVEDN